MGCGWTPKAVDDQVVAQVDFDKTKRVLVNIYPSPESEYWRFGLGFSPSGNRPRGRAGPGYPLWHLTKNGAGAVLRVDYYDEFGKAATSRVVLDPYHGEPVTFEVGASSGALDIKVYGSPGYTQKLGLASHRHASLSGWADSKAYSLAVFEEELLR